MPGGRPEAQADDERRAAAAAGDRAAARGRVGRSAQQQLAAAQAEAERLVGEARDRVRELATVRSTVLNQLSAVRGILDRVPNAASASLEEWPARD